MVFKFRMLSDENDHFVRDYEVPYDMTLLGFHEFITRSLGYEEGMSSFFTADKQWNRLREFTLMDMGDNSEDAPLPDGGHNARSVDSQQSRPADLPVRPHGRPGVLPPN